MVTIGVMEPSRILVCYASAAGSTRGIAERIAHRLRHELDGYQPDQCEVTCQPVGPDLDPAKFAALIVGSAVHNMAWLPEAISFLSRLPAHSAPPVWTFSVGSVEPRGPVTRLLVSRERIAVERGFPAGLTLREHRVFGGVVVMTGVPLWGRLFWRLTGGRPGDHRNWPAIEQWAAGIATELTGLVNESTR